MPLVLFDGDLPFERGELLLDRVSDKNGENVFSRKHGEHVFDGESRRETLQTLFVQEEGIGSGVLVDRCPLLLEGDGHLEGKVVLSPLGNVVHGDLLWL